MLCILTLLITAVMSESEDPLRPITRLSRFPSPLLGGSMQRGKEIFNQPPICVVFV